MEQCCGLSLSSKALFFNFAHFWQLVRRRCWMPLCSSFSFDSDYFWKVVCGTQYLLFISLKQISELWSIVEKRAKKNFGMVSLQFPIYYSQYFHVVQCNVINVTVQNLHQCFIQYIYDQVTNYSEKGAIFPTPPKSYATIFFGVQRTLFWSN